MASLILAILEKMLVYGPGVVVEIARLFQNDKIPIPQEIRDLTIVKSPEDYF